MSEKYIGTKFKTIFQGKFIPTKKEEILIENLIKIGKELGGMGCRDNNGGNFSVRTKNGIIIKTTGSFPHKLKKSDFVLVSGFKKDKVYIYGQKEPSSEARLHWGIYQVRFDVNCVLHTHDFVVVHCPIKVNEVKYIKEIPYGTLESARAIKNASKNNNYLIMKNHGVLAVGKNIPTALKLIKKYHEKFKRTTKSTTANCGTQKK